MTIWTKAYWKAQAERTISTAAQTAVGAIGATALIESVDWAVVGSTVALASVLSVLKGIVANSATGTGPGATTAEQTEPAPVKTQTHRADI
jgi:hypothetical protein